MDSEGISDGLSAERKVEIRVRKNGRKDKVIVEKSAAEGLPEGWIKKLEISNRKGCRARRDPFFIDPKSGYIFQSFKDASRYVETGHIGHYARKLKENNIEDDDDSGNQKKSNIVPLRAVEKKKEIDICVETSKRRNLPSSDEHSENCELMNSDLGKKEEARGPMEKQPMAKRVTRSQAKASKKEENSGFKRTNLSEEGKQIRDLEKESAMTEKKEVQDSTEKRITRSKAKVEKKEISTSVITRRASKRLAGIELEPTPELKSTTKAQRVVVPADAGNCKQPVNPEDIPVNQERGKCYNEHSSSKPNAASNNCVSAEIEMGKALGRNGCGEQKKKKSILISEVEPPNPVFHLEGYKHKEEMSLVSPLSRKTCGTKCEKSAGSPKATETPPLPLRLRSSNKGEYPCDNGNGAIQRRNRLVSNNSFGKGSCMEEVTETNSLSPAAFDSTLAHLWKDPCIAFAIKTLTGESLCLPNTGGRGISSASDPKNSDIEQKGPETAGNVNEKPSADIWEDPCIEFAIKTLTGAIPVGLEDADNKPK